MKKRKETKGGGLGGMVRPAGMSAAAWGFAVTFTEEAKLIGSVMKAGMEKVSRRMDQASRVAARITGNATADQVAAVTREIDEIMSPVREIVQRVRALK